MRRVVAGLVLLAACGGTGSGSSNRGTVPLSIEVPATIVGELEISVEEGPVGDDDLSEVNFGSVETRDGLVLIEVWADVVRTAGLSRGELVAGGRYQVELSGSAEYSSPDAPSYLVAGLTPDR